MIVREGVVLVPVSREILDELCGDGWSEPVRVRATIDERTGMAELTFQRVSVSEDSP